MVRDSQYSFIGQKWRDFLDIARKPLVVTESPSGSRTFESASDAIANGGDVGFVSYLAKCASVDTICLEPPSAEEIKYLENKFRREEIYYYYFARSIAQWYRIADRFKPNLTPYVEHSLNAVLSKRIELEHMARIHSSLFGGLALDVTNSKWFELIENPLAPTNPLRSVANASRRYRDDVVSNLLRQRWITHDLFLVYGATHAIEYARRLTSTPYYST